MISPGIDEAFLMNLIIAAGAIIHCSVGFWFGPNRSTLTSDGEA